ncbi:hypothetical protein GVAV_000792 [Gurleya vavrai]
MKLFFLLILRSYKLSDLTFENMFNNDLEIVLKEKEKEFKKIESEAKCNVIVFFSFDEDKLAFKSITEIKKDLFSKLNIEDTGKSIIAIENKNCRIDFENKEKYHFNRFLKKIEQKLENFDIKISEISPDNFFGMITEGIINTKFKNTERTSQKDVFIADNYPKDDIFSEKNIGDYLINQTYNPNFICLFSNFQMTKPDLEYCSKIFDVNNIKPESFYESFCCLSLKIKESDIKNLTDLLNSLYDTHFKKENNSLSKNQYYIHLKPKIINSETIFYDTNACLFHDYDQKSLKNLFTDNKCRCDFKKPFKIRYDAKNYFFTLAVLNKASEKANKTLNDFYPTAKIEKILVCTLQELFKKQVLYFYKISEILAVEIANEKNQILKITVLVLFKIGECTNKFEFFYYENIENRLRIDYEIEKVQESQIIFVSFCKNLVCLLQKNDFGFIENYNIFYHVFIKSDIEPSNTTCFNFMDILQTGKKTSYINYIKTICSIYFYGGFDYKLYKFKCENYELLNKNFCSVIEYNDQKMITDLQVVDLNTIVFEKDYFFMIKNLRYLHLKANLCILPCFENIRNFNFEIEKEKIKKSIEYLKKNILMELNSNHSESKIMKEYKPTNSHEIKFIKENGWLNDFFDTKINNNNIKNFINDLNFKEFRMLSDKNSKFNVKSKLIVDWLRNNISESNKNNQNFLSEIKTKISNSFTKANNEPILMDLEQKFTKVILHLFEQNQINFNYRNFEFPKAVYILYFDIDDQTLNQTCYELRNFFKNKKNIEFIKISYLEQSNKTIESI